MKNDETAANGTSNEVTTLSSDATRTATHEDTKKTTTAVDDDETLATTTDSSAATEGNADGMDISE